MVKRPLAEQQPQRPWAKILAIVAARSDLATKLHFAQVWRTVSTHAKVAKQLKDLLILCPALAQRTVASKPKRNPQN